MIKVEFSLTGTTVFKKAAEDSGTRSVCTSYVGCGCINKRLKCGGAEPGSDILPRPEYTLAEMLPLQIHEEN